MTKFQKKLTIEHFQAEKFSYNIIEYLQLFNGDCNYGSTEFSFDGEVLTKKSTTTYLPDKLGNVRTEVDIRQYYTSNDFHIAWQILNERGGKEFFFKSLETNLLLHIQWMLEVYTELNDEEIKRGLGSKNRQIGSLSGVIGYSKSRGEIERLPNRKYKLKTRIERQEARLLQPLSPSAIKACKKRAKEFKEMNIFSHS